MKNNEKKSKKKISKAAVSAIASDVVSEKNAASEAATSKTEKNRADTKKEAKKSRALNGKSASDVKSQKKRARGRPPKHPLRDPSEPKRPRGRPRKKVESATPTQGTATDSKLSLSPKTTEVVTLEAAALKKQNKKSSQSKSKAKKEAALGNDASGQDLASGTGQDVKKKGLAGEPKKNPPKKISSGDTSPILVTSPSPASAATPAQAPLDTALFQSQTAAQLHHFDKAKRDLKPREVAPLPSNFDALSQRFRELSYFLDYAQLNPSTKESQSPKGARSLSLASLVAHLGEIENLEFGTSLPSYLSRKDAIILSSGGSGKTGKKMPLNRIEFFDEEIQRSVAERFVESSRERIDPTLLMKDKVYTALWTNRVAMWRFFERYAVPMNKRNEKDAIHQLRFHAASFSNHTNAKENEISHLNPFAAYGRAFQAIYTTWRPLMKRIIRVFVSNTSAGQNYRDDFESIAAIAFLHALEKQAMAMLGSLADAQSVPFSKRLEFGVRKAIRCDLPDMTGPVRVPIESKQRKSMPSSISLEVLFGENHDF